jgi:hypothetical protein
MHKTFSHGFELMPNIFKKATDASEYVHLISEFVIATQFKKDKQA